MELEYGRFNSTADVSFYYGRYGNPSGVPMVLLNGGPGRSHSALFFGPAWETLGRACPIIVYDQRGTGQSSPLPPDAAWTLADQVDDLEVLRQHLGVEQIDLLGHSWGGYLGMAYTARHGERVRRLVLVDSAAPRIQETVTLFRNFFPEASAERLALRPAMMAGDRAALAAAERLYFSMLCYAPERRDAYLEIADPADLCLDVARASGMDLSQHDLTPDLAHFQQPTLVITGRFDVNVAPSVAYAIHHAIPDSRFAVFARSGHLPFFEEPELFAQTVGDFLAE